MNSWLYLTAHCVAEGLETDVDMACVYAWHDPAAIQSTSLNEAAARLKDHEVNLILPMELCSWLLTEPWPNKRRPGDQALAFAGLCLMLALIPGPDTFMVLRISLNRVGAGVAAAAGSGTGALVWAALVGLGLAAILEQSAEVFRWIKIAGGLYLLYLGLSSFIKARKAAKAGLATGEAPEPLVYSKRAGYGAGLVSTLLNPKVGLFYLASNPQHNTAPSIAIHVERPFRILAPASIHSR